MGYHYKKYLLILRYLDVYVYAMALSPLGDSFVKMNVTFHREYTEGEIDLLQDILLIEILHFIFPLKVSYQIG